MTDSMQPADPKPRKGAGLYHEVMYRLGGMLVNLGTRLQTKKPPPPEESDPV